MYSTQTKKTTKGKSKKLAESEQSEQPEEPHYETQYIPRLNIYFRSLYFKENPKVGEKSLVEASKIWNSMTDEEKYPYRQKFEEHRASYAKFQATDEYKRIQELKDEVAELCVDKPKPVHPEIIFISQRGRSYTFSFYYPQWVSTI